MDVGHYNVVATRKLGLVLYQSVLRVYNTTTDDHGRYKCVATNELGSDSLVIALDGTSQYKIPIRRISNCLLYYLHTLCSKTPHFY